MDNISASARASIKACREIFGEYPEDVISQLKSASDALFWLEEIFRSISEASDNTRIKHLAEAGMYIAFDVGEFVGTCYEDMIGRLRDA